MPPKLLSSTFVESRILFSCKSNPPKSELGAFSSVASSCSSSATAAAAAAAVFVTTPFEVDDAPAAGARSSWPRAPRPPVQSRTFSPAPQPVKLEVPDGHGKDCDPLTPGQHWSPLQHASLPGQRTRSPTAHTSASRQSLVAATELGLPRGPLVDAQSETFVLCRQTSNPGLADGHGKGGPPSMPGQHSSPLQQTPLPGQRTRSPTTHESFTGHARSGLTSGTMAENKNVVPSSSPSRLLAPPLRPLEDSEASTT
mmetsp:Transcript_66967/g.217941  ORF Transcript_66967/g.217941 Transcript_66967/m.217941 type:complete len:255 (-) Transcript_66967:738-1502(-)